ncbi:type II toxin-antitoxin system Phd/YefM family antitoxin [Methylocystis hirsuta]|uniref:Antitoxin n=1 Tax=Methylocystis hirsuta TaxID=369798 RepID=A0A3M9XMX5_9HYPH|nr:type II toxin-antitoxin system prevent-host-death family antitoxin [Methylocystis hirsuta]RNJ49639.1 type II toxin-antitoxin system prevent-host-death family antitoxin [Methylocystis hirsuta]
MRKMTQSDLRKNLAATLDRVTEDREPVAITRDKGKPAAVLISLEDFASYEETSYLLRSSRNAERLREAIEELDAGRGEARKKPCGRTYENSVATHHHWRAIRTLIK